MEHSIWVDAHASIVLLPSGELGQELLTLVNTWAESGLIGPAFWVSPESVTTFVDEPPRIRAQVVGCDASRVLVTTEVDLFEQLAREEFEKVRLLKVRSATPSFEEDALQDQIVESVESYLRFSTPFASVQSSDSQQAQVLEVVTLVAPTTQHKARVSLSQTRKGVGTTVVAAPEDRSTPWSPDAFVRDDERYKGFLLMHIVTTAGIWFGLQNGLTDLVNQESSNQSDVYLSRVFVSAVLTDGLARRISAEALKEAADGNRALSVAPAGTVFIDDADQDAYVHELADNYMFHGLEGGILSYQPFVQGEDGGKRNLSIGAQIAEYLRFARHALASIPKWAWRGIKQGLSRKVQDKLQGADGDATVNAELFAEQLDARDNLLLQEFKTLVDLAQESRVSMNTPLARSQVRSTPGLWKSIRTKLFATLDGGLAHEETGFPEKDGGIRPIFRAVSALFQQPDEIFTFPENLPLPDTVKPSYGWSDMASTSSVQAELTNWVAEVENSLTVLSTQLIEKKEDLANREQELFDLTTVLRENDALEFDDKGIERPITIAAAEGRLSAPFARSASSKTFPEPLVSTVELGDSEGDSDSTQIDESAPGEEISELTNDAGDQTGPIVEGTPEDHSLEGVPAEVKGPRARKTKKESAPQTEARQDKVDEPSVAIENPEVPQLDDLADDSAESPLEEETVEETKPDLPGLLRQHRDLKKQIKGLVAEVESTKKAQEEAAARRDERSATLQAFTEWTHALERTFIWKLQARMKLEQGRVEEHTVALEQAIEETKAPQPGTLISLRKKFHKRLLVVIPSLFLLAGLIVLYCATIGFGLIPIVGWLAQTVILATMISLVAGILVTYFSTAALYYSGHSKFIRAMKDEERRLKGVADAYTTARKEAIRLEALHSQTIDWIELLARALHQPWLVKPDWLSPGLRSSETLALPFAMRVAQTDDNDFRSQNQLHDRAMRALLVRGWRQIAFNELVGEIGSMSSQGFASDGVDFLDNDMPHVSNGGRDVVRQHLASPELLENIARIHIRPLIHDLQTSAMTLTKPQVVVTDDNPLAGLAYDTEGLDTSHETMQDWDRFLSRTLFTNPSQLRHASPLSALAIADAEVSTGIHARVSSFAIVPEHLGAAVDYEAAGIKTVVYSGTRSRPIEAVIRMDVVGPLSPETLSLWQNTVSTPARVEDEAPLMPTRRIFSTEP
jgi:hypothetical protein